MITCPVCSNQELEGAIFCTECGAQLVFGVGMQTSHIQHSKSFQTASHPESPSVHAPIDMAAFSPEVVAKLHLLQAGVYLPIMDRREVILGRASEGQSVLPDIDLGPFQAFQAGVSRLHATVQVTEEGQIILIDLGSSNGTSINGLRIKPQTPHVIQRGDIVSLGKLKLEIIVRA